MLLVMGKGGFPIESICGNYVECSCDSEKCSVCHNPYAWKNNNGVWSMPRSVLYPEPQKHSWWTKLCSWCL